MKNEINSFSSYYRWREMIEDGVVDFYFEKYLNEQGLKIKKDAQPIKYVDVQVAGHWKRGIRAYAMEDTIEIIKRNVKLLEPTVTNLCKALYLINKSAKISRDTKIINYKSKNFKTVNGAKTREVKLYELKDKVIDKMYSEGLLKLEGYHTQKSFKEVPILLLYRSDKYAFHKPIFEKEKQLTYIKNFENLGEIDIISSERKEIKGINFFEAKLLLENYIE
ncbi:MAG: YkyB family protein [Sarcina sp.]